MNITPAVRLPLMLLLILLFVNTVTAMPFARDIDTLRRAYPNISFITSYDRQKADYLITINRDDNKPSYLYWAEGKMLAADKLPTASSYWPILYPYPDKIPDPSRFTSQDVTHIRERTSQQTRKDTAGTSQDFFDAIYDSGTRLKTESHIKRTQLFNHQVSVHEWIIPALRQVENETQLLANQDKEVRAFINDISRVEGYNWREITDRSSRSFHSYGIAIDILPKNWREKNIYWAWRRDKDPENWMLLPLERRWMPPAAVIHIFEKHGFIWGGKWMVWDNMHFEYHPELLDKF